MAQVPRRAYVPRVGNDEAAALVELAKGGAAMLQLRQGQVPSLTLRTTARSRPTTVASREVPIMEPGGAAIKSGRLPMPELLSIYHHFADPALKIR